MLVIYFECYNGVLSNINFINRYLYKIKYMYMCLNVFLIQFNKDFMKN